MSLELLPVPEVVLLDVPDAPPLAAQEPPEVVRVLLLRRDYFCLPLVVNLQVSSYFLLSLQPKHEPVERYERLKLLVLVDLNEVVHRILPKPLARGSLEHQ